MFGIIAFSLTFLRTIDILFEDFEDYFSFRSNLKELESGSFFFSFYALMEEWDKMFEWNTKVRYSETGTSGKLTIAGLINLFQDCSNFQSESVGVGLKWLTEHRIGWVILKWQVDMKRFPALAEDITLCTFPYKFRASFAQRNFLLKDAQGEVIACADSMWMQVNLDTHQPVPITEEVISHYVHEERYPMDYSRKKIILSDDAVKESSFIIGCQNLDTNGHVNNGQYISFAMPYLDSDRGIRRFEVEYRNQAFLGDEIIPFVSKEEEKCVVSFQNPEGNPYAVLQCEYDMKAQGKEE